VLKTTTYNIKNGEYFFLFSIIIFLFSPFFSMLFQIFFIYVFNVNKKHYFTALIITISLFLGLINATKFPETDLNLYLHWYERAGNLSLPQFLLRTEKTEPLFDVFSYFLYYLFGGSRILYITCLSFIIYYFFLSAIYKLYSYYKSDSHVIILAIVLGGLFPQLFSVSANIIRQLLAASLIFYFIVNRIFYNKNYWIIFIISIFIHSSVLFLVPFVFIDVFIKSFKFKNILRFFILTAPITSLLINFYNNIFGFIIHLVNNPFLAYAFLRILRPRRNVLYDPPELTVVILVSVLLVFVVYYVILNRKGKNISNSYRHFSLVYLGFVLVFFATFNVTEISHRMLYFAYYFMPFIFPFLVIKKKRSSNKLISGSIIIFIVFYFMIKLNTSVWIYASNIHIYGDLLLYQFYGPR